jgi:Chitin binding Peritrophin-A domain
LQFNANCYDIICYHVLTNKFSNKFHFFIGANFLSFQILTIFVFFLHKNVESSCGVCNTSSNFSCVSSTQYIKCNTTILDYTSVWTCPHPSICDENLPLATPLSLIPCYQNVTASNVTYLASCDLPVQTIVFNTTPSSVFNASSWCSSRSAGLYPHPIITSCISYVRCYRNNNTITGAVFKCPGTSRFNNIALVCDVNVTC